LERILLIEVFLPLVVGFVLLFLPNRLKSLAAALALVLSVIAFALAIRIFTSGAYDDGFSVLHIGDLKLDLMLTAKPLGAFVLMFAMGFGLLITLYSLKSTAAAKHPTQYFGAVLITIGGSAGILLCNHLLFLLIFWEIVTASLYLLIATGGRNSNFAATKSFAMIGASDAAFMLGVFLVCLLSEPRTFVICRPHPHFRL